ncbi:PAS domain S-box protein [uncultured Thiocystis sp.]|jgi:PAS domain S-box-containing protein|uniref:hybrid sensor histidine kinase/response regulator n=1 Tax=uncultured Thiocystis sp. TaxID=1202134 RepID=UPI0025F4C54D|nr:PAS domain S-box protein [uncultured Thiocystis sp.]
MAPIRQRRTTFWRYNLFLEFSALLLISAILFLTIWLAMGELGQRYLQLRLADANKVDLFIGKQLDEARQDVERFIALPEPSRSPEVLRFLDAFSDLYRLDEKLRVARMYKATAGSRVFVGFSLSGGKLGGYLRTLDARAAFSDIMRGYEDDAPSVYLALRSAGDLYLGRLNLSYVQDFLSEFSRFAGTPLMLVASDGFVMLSGDADLKFPSIDLKHWAGAPSARRTLHARGQDWIPLISTRITLGARIVTLIPTQPLETQRSILLLATLGFLAGMILLVYLKNRRLNRLLLQPVAAFAERMRDLERGRPLAGEPSGQRFVEIDSIHTRFRTMAEAIAQRERSLRESEEKFRLAFDNANTGMCLVDPQGRLLQVNDKMTAIFGYRQQELEGMSVNDLAVPEDLGLSPGYMGQAVRGEGDSATFEKRYRHRHGQIIDCQIASSLVRDAQGQPRYFISQVQDVSERRRHEQELQQARDAAELANRAKSAFLANMSHEIRTPLNAILGFAQVLMRAPELSAEHGNQLATILRSGQHLLALLNDILDMAKIEAGRLTCERAPFDPAALIRETEAIFRPRAHDQGLTLSVATHQLPRRVAGDALKLRQVLINLVSNAIKFTRSGTVILSAEGRGGDRIHFSVADTGIGIAPDELERIFDPFTQAESGRVTPGGTGLGLALSRQFVRLMGGALSVTSVPGQGSRFTFALTLPPVDVAEPAPLAPRGRILGLEPDQPLQRVLVADDLEDNRAPLCALLNALNPRPPVLEIREAANGREAVEIWETWQPQVIFMDMRMPVMSGEEATRAIKARMRERSEAVRSIVVALTASAFDEQRDHFLAIGCDAFARKPFEADELLDLLERHAGLRLTRDTAPPPTPSLSPAVAAERLAACPAEWRAALEQAVELADFERIGALLEGIRGRDSALEHTLAHWAYTFDLERFMALCADAGRRSGLPGDARSEPD